MSTRVSLGRAIAAELALRAQPRRRAAFRVPAFFPEAQAQRRTLGPGLPHHRHPLTADEALAGLLLLALIVGGAFYLGWTYL